MPHRLLFTVTTDLSYDQRMQRICTTLAEQGYDVHLCGRQRAASVPLRDTPYRQTRLRCWFDKGKLFYLEYNVRLFFWLLRQPADALCGIDLDTALPAWLVARLKRIPFVFDAHEHFTEMEEVVRRPLVQRIWQAVEALVVPRTRYAYTVGPSIARLLEEKYGTPFAVIRNVSPLRTTEVTPQAAEVPYLLYVGAVNEGRGLEELLAVMPHLPCHLYICGEGDRLEALKAQAQALHLNEKVRFFGYVEPHRLPPLLAGATAGYLMLTNQGLSYYYSLANKFFDYLHAGIPQITVDFPEYRALNAQYEVALLTELRPEAIRAAVETLWYDRAFYERLAENARRARHELNWQRESQKLLRFYEGVFAGAGAVASAEGASSVGVTPSK
ncbi:Glycosyltransferase involved in cell wall bisynthesis [Catalinimonas alkaloidigena]|uniref:Glycosyltransferase involved in cell wall bisynthesis n=1 Tax=Catalinimonas alkaloidigena TaxID=1075417 RepID=A0A1G9GSK5_9BACT|nr:glycosyltransferase [Catalinimonas alkaloidigena]SDL03676.1 Glycosyltransferase involved in cell wall bisynthesis [Catalinimonas alkaloidigena]